MLNQMVNFALGGDPLGEKKLEYTCHPGARALESKNTEVQESEKLLKRHERFSGFCQVWLEILLF